MFERFDTELFRKMGITDLAGIIAPVIEDNSIDGRPPLVFVKFMSDAGKRDEEQGLAFRALLDRSSVPYCMAPSGQARSFAWVDQVALEALIGLPVFGSAS